MVVDIKKGGVSVTISINDDNEYQARHLVDKIISAITGEDEFDAIAYDAYVKVVEEEKENEFREQALKAIRKRNNL